MSGKKPILVRFFTQFFGLQYACVTIWYVVNNKIFFAHYLHTYLVVSREL